MLRETFSFEQPGLKLPMAVWMGTFDMSGADVNGATYSHFFQTPIGVPGGAPTLPIGYRVEPEECVSQGVQNLNSFNRLLVCISMAFGTDDATDFTLRPKFGRTGLWAEFDYLDTVPAMTPGEAIAGGNNHSWYVFDNPFAPEFMREDHPILSGATPASNNTLQIWWVCTNGAATETAVQLNVTSILLPSTSASSKPARGWWVSDNQYK